MDIVPVRRSRRGKGRARQAFRCGRGILRAGFAGPWRGCGGVGGVGRQERLERAGQESSL